MVTIEVNDQSEAGKLLLEMALFFAKNKEGVRIIDTEETITENKHSDDDQVLDEGMQYLISKSKAFAFLEDEEELYSDEDLIEKFHEKR